LALSAGQSSAAEVVASIDRGVLVTSMMGLHSGVNPVSGDFSVGIEGILITDGELGQPIREATMASSLLRMLGNVTAIGADVEWLPANAAGQTLAVADVTMSGR
jgi:PmbA protein